MMEDIKRAQILNDFSQNILIEAGAGAGKTTILVNRILNQIKTSDITLDKMVAITFTEKAARGLQERFQRNLFKAYSGAQGNEKEKLKKAIADMDKIHISTIHSFCSSMLKEMPFEAGLSLDFTIVQDQADVDLKKGLFAQFCEQAAIDPQSRQLKEKLAKVGINPHVLADTFYAMCEKDKVEWIYNEKLLNEDPQIFFKGAMKILKLICDVLIKKEDATTGFTVAELKGGGTFSEDESPVIKDGTLAVYRWFKQNEKEPLDCMEMLDKLDEKMNLCAAQNSKKKNYNQALLEKGKMVNKMLKKYELGEALIELKETYSQYRHGLCIAFLMNAMAFFKLEKKKEKKLTNKDLLIFARDMIKGSELARQFFSKKYTYFYIDEFQDTDPIQTELIFYLACSEKKLPKNWENCQLKTGSLCMVGDPKQSIFAFTGADIKLYNRVKEKMERDDNSQVYYLNRNYRSNRQLCDWITQNYAQEISGFGFPAKIKAGSSQAIFEGMTTLAPKRKSDNQTLNGVYRYHLEDGSKEELINQDAPYIAELIANLIEKKVQLIRYNPITKASSIKVVTPGDFLVITWFTTTMPSYIKALKEKGIPVSVAGKIETKALAEINNLVLLLGYLNDYRNSYRLALVLEKLFGCHLQDDQRFRYHQIIWNEQEINNLPNELVKESLLFIRQLLMLVGSLPPMVVVETIVNDFKRIVANKNYDQITLNAAMGNVEQLLELVRSKPYSTFSDIVIELENLIENALDREMSITDLIEENGQYNAVRIMNLHKAKGLEGNIVILADPATGVSGFQESMIFIEEEGLKKGFVIPKNGYKHIGKPQGWEEAKVVAKVLREQEHLRLLYVATTRAKEALIVSSGNKMNLYGKSAKNTAWKELEVLIPINQETTNFADGLFDYPAFAKGFIGQEEECLKNWGIANTRDKFLKHKLWLDSKIEQAQKSLASHINPSQFLNHRSLNNPKKSVDHTASNSFRGNLYGIIVHKLFQLLVESRGLKTRDGIALEGLIKKSIHEGLENQKLTKKQCHLLNLAESLENQSFIDQYKALYDGLRKDLQLKAEKFCQDQIFWKRIDNADAVYTELPFQLLVKAKAELYSLIDETEEVKRIYMRGIMDLVIVKGKTYTIIDYKTNAKEEGEDLEVFKEYINALYQPQLQLYELAMREMVADIEVESMLYLV